jgi:hypothetical protein
MTSTSIDTAKFVKDLEGTQLAFDAQMKLYIPSLPSKAPDSFITGICSRWGAVTNIISGKRSFGPDNLKSVTISINWTDTHENRVSQLALSTKQMKIDYELHGKMQYFFVKKYAEPPVQAPVVAPAPIEAPAPPVPVQVVQTRVSSMLPANITFVEKAKGPQQPEEKDGSRQRTNTDTQLMDYNALLQENFRLRSENARLTEENKRLIQDLEDQEIAEKERELRAQLEELSARRQQRGGKK